MSSQKRRWWALGALCLCLLTFGFDATILNVALPTLATAVDAGTSELQWIVDAYILVFAGLLLPAGALGDRLGRKRVLLTGLVLFTLSSVGAAYVSSAGQLVAARAVMGLGAAIMLPVGMSMLTVIFEPQERARAIAVATVFLGIGVPLGPIIGGWLLDRYWWGSVFLVNVPVAAVGLIAAAILLPESRDEDSRPVDVPGGLLSTAGLVALVYGIIEAPDRGWADGLVLGSLAAGALLLLLFVAWEQRLHQGLLDRVPREPTGPRRPYPMIDLGLFRRPRFLFGTMTGTLANFALFGLLFVVPQFLQSVRGFDAFGTGLRLLPMMAGLIVGAPLAERVAARVGAKVPITAGLAVIAAALAFGATTKISTGYGHSAAWLFAVGAGVGLAMAPAMDAVLGELPPSRAGSGTALMMTLRQVGGALGVALLGSVLSAEYTARLDTSMLPPAAAGAARDSIAAAVATGTAEVTGAPAAYVHGMDAVLLVCAGLAAVGAILAAWRMPARASGEEESVHGEQSRAA